MKKCLTLLAFCLCIIMNGARSQMVYEWGIKPTELVVGNMEANFALGNKFNRYGIILAYRPSKQQSGFVSGETGLFTNYDMLNYSNPLYTAYTVGLTYKKYSRWDPARFLEIDLFYRDWGFKNKYAQFGKTGSYKYNGLRTENIDVGGIKILVGQTIILGKKNKPVRAYVDIYGGFGIRFKSETYQTYNGTVNNIYHDYYEEQDSQKYPSFQLGLHIGIVKRNRLK